MATLQVTIEDARDRLPELVARAAAGDKVVITDTTGLPVVLATGSEPRPEPAVEAFGRRVEAIRTFLRNWDQDGITLPADHELRKLVADWDGANR